MKTYYPGSGVKPITDTFVIDIDGTRVAYTYVRKNGCRTFKHLFQSYSKHDFSACKSSLSAMRTFHRASSLDEIDGSDYRIFVYRDPVERVVSAYKHKFVQMKGNKDIFTNFKRVTGLSPNRCRFVDFVDLYVSRLNELSTSLDCHVLPMYMHAFPVHYNAVIDIKDLYKDMSSILGKEVADAHFLKKHNSTEGRLDFNFPRQALYMEAKELHDYYHRYQVTPSVDDLLNGDIEKKLKGIYREDYKMIESFE